MQSMSFERIVSTYIYYPEPYLIATPDRLGLRFEEVLLESEPGVDLHAWFFSRSDPLATLLFCHGNAGNISHRLENVRYLVEAGLQVLLFDYRGYGRSTGEPSEAGLYRDAEVAWNHMVGRQDAAGAPHVIFGRSLGGAVAIDLASRVAADGLIVESTFTSIQTLARLIFPFPVPNLPVKYDSLSKVKKLKIPLLAIHGMRDELIPYQDGKALFDAAPEPKAWYPIPGAGHNDTYLVGGQVYFQRLASFSREVEEKQDDDSDD
jgi:fermentation-respiration switch protein FrsA (DUF1100 family)